MFATDFLFNSQRLSDFGCMICSFDGDSQTVSGGEIEYNVVKAPNKDKFGFYGAQFNTVLTWNFSICKNPCKNNGNMYFDQYEESMLANWLIEIDGYKAFQFDQEGYEDIFYFVTINMHPHQVAGKTAGYDLTVTSNCGYGFTDEIVKRTVINKNKPYNLNVYNDVKTYILPYVTITGNGNFYISNDSDKMYNASLGKASKFNNVSGTIVMDSENDIPSGLRSPDDFNWYFMRLVCGVNKITTDSQTDVELEIKYREARRVIV